MAKADLWDADRVEELLEFSGRLLRQEPWGPWLLARGGLTTVLDYLRSLPLTRDESRLLNLLIDEPRAVAQTYIKSLNISRSTYFRLRPALLESLATHLNSWVLAPAPAPAARGSSAPSPAALAPLQRTNLPHQPTLLVGRRREVDEIKRLLLQPSIRLLTLSGPGGIGKTRLSIQVGRELSVAFKDGVWFVPLASVRDPDLVLSTIAHALGLIEVPGLAPAEMLANYLREKQVLLVLDNFEQVVPAAGLVGELLTTAGQIKILVTSRELLRVYGEYDLPVPPLTLPPEDAPAAASAVAEAEAVQLFVERARAVRADFVLAEETLAAVAEICRRLEGLPLAIELAAARIRLFTPQVMLARLTKRFDLLVGGARNLPPRQQTLRGTIDWSYELLEPEERTLFARLAIFVGPWTLQAAETVCASADLPAEAILSSVDSLLSKSLLLQQVGHEDEPHFRMLETIREYALERLVEAEELAPLQQRHAAFYTALAERAAPGFAGPQQELWVKRVEQDHDNLRAALTWALARDPEAAARLAASLWRFWSIRGYMSEGRAFLTGVLGSGDALPDALRGKVLQGAGWLAESQGDHAMALELSREALTLAQRLDNRAGIAMALYLLGRVDRSQGDYLQATTRFDESLTLARAENDRWLEAAALNGLGFVLGQQGEHEQARGYLKESLALSREVGDQERLAAILQSLGSILWAEGAYEEAQGYLEQSGALSERLGDRLGMTISLGNLGVALLAQGKYEQARDSLEESCRISAELGDKMGVSAALVNLGDIAFELQDPEHARALYLQALEVARQIDNLHLIAVCLHGLALAVAQHQPEAAALLFGAESQLLESVGAAQNAFNEARYTAVLDALRQQLSPQLFEQAWARGRTLPLDQLIDYALRLA